jgi:hypothetical protein
MAVCNGGEIHGSQSATGWRRSRFGELGFRNAAAHVQDPGLRSMCYTIARKRSQFAEELMRNRGLIASNGLVHDAVLGAVRQGSRVG